MRCHRRSGQIHPLRTFTEAIRRIDARVTHGEQAAKPLFTLVAAGRSNHPCVQARVQAPRSHAP